MASSRESIHQYLCGNVYEFYFVIELSCLQSSKKHKFTLFLISNSTNASGATNSVWFCLLTFWLTILESPISRTLEFWVFLCTVSSELVTCCQQVDRSVAPPNLCKRVVSLASSEFQLTCYKILRGTRNDHLKLEFLYTNALLTKSSRQLGWYVAFSFSYFGSS